jgi:homoserine kinase
VAAALAADAALGAGLGPDELLACALAGEAVASGAEHADNVAACLHGGIVLTPTGSPPRPVALPVPRDLAVALLHPPVELATRQARAVLGAEIPLATAVAQWGRLAAFVAALYREDWELLGRSMVDLVAEPRRAHLVPGFREMQAAALAHGALGCSLSGAGPSVFALCRGVEVAAEVGRSMADALTSATGLEGDLVVGEIERQGAHLVSP